MKTRREMQRWTRHVLGVLTAASATATAGGCARDAVTGRDDGGSGATGGSGGGGGFGGALPDHLACRNPQPVLVDGKDTGVVLCDAGWQHRARVVACEPFAPSAAEACPETAAGGACDRNADCGERDYGSCLPDIFGNNECFCHYGCRADADCGDGGLCLCDAGGGGHCITAQCKVDADCGNGLCATAESNPYCGGTIFQCQVAEDACMADADCAEREICGTEDGARICINGGCVIGRPFLVEGVARVAPVSFLGAEVPSGAGHPWSDPAQALPARPDDPATCDRLAAFFTRAGQLEHASVAAFARFSLELLAFGAPPSLLLQTQAAMADETAHARLCFTLAGHYAGRPIAPGPLSMAGALLAPTLADAVEAAIIEGCLGETLAAVEASVVAADSPEPALRDAFERLAADERRHAELAWQFVQWALHTGGATVRERARAVFATRLDDLNRETSAPEPHLGAHGIATGRARDRYRQTAARHVVGPLAAALLAAA